MTAASQLNLLISKVEVNRPEEKSVRLLRGRKGRGVGQNYGGSRAERTVQGDLNSLIFQGMVNM